MRPAAATASSTVVTASPFDTGMSKEAKNCFPWYSKRSTLCPSCLGPWRTRPVGPGAGATALESWVVVRRGILNG